MPSWLAAAVLAICAGVAAADESVYRLPPIEEQVSYQEPVGESVDDLTLLEEVDLYSPDLQTPCPKFQVMPVGLLYPSYLAGAKEPRFASYWSSDKKYGQLWDTTLGGRIGILRYGIPDTERPQGWQIDLEGAAMTRLDPQAESTPLLAADFRMGIPFTWARGAWQWKTGYYHISSHLGDEYLLENPGARRLNYVRDAICFGIGWYATERLRLYTEMDYAVGVNGGAEPLEFQFGADWAPALDTGLRGGPFAAINGHLREEVDFGGNLVIQAGWAWRGGPRRSLFRIGLEYFNGMSDQFEFYDRSEQRLGWGLWADY